MAEKERCTSYLMKFTEKTLVKHLNKCYGADYTRARFQRDPIGGSQILLYRSGDVIPEIVDATTPQALAQDMGFFSGSLVVSGLVTIAMLERKKERLEFSEMLAGEVL